MANVQLPPRYCAVHATGGALLYTMLGAAWALVAVLNLKPWSQAWLNIALGLMTGTLLILGIRAFRQAVSLPEVELTAAQQKERARRERRSRQVLRVEGFLITAVSAALLLANQPIYIASANALIVGLHFIALAAVHHTPGEYLLGGLMVALSGTAMYWAPNYPFAGPRTMNVVTGLGSAAILWGGSIVRLFHQAKQCKRR